MRPARWTWIRNLTHRARVVRWLILGYFFFCLVRILFFFKLKGGIFQMILEKKTKLIFGDKKWYEDYCFGDKDNVDSTTYICLHRVKIEREKPTCVNITIALFIGNCRFLRLSRSRSFPVRSPHFVFFCCFIYIQSNSTANIFQFKVSRNFEFGALVCLHPRESVWEKQLVCKNSRVVHQVVVPFFF